MDNVVIIKSVYSQGVYQDGLFIEEQNLDTETSFESCKYVINKKDIDYILKNGFYKNLKDFNQNDIKELDCNSSTIDFIIDMTHNILILALLIFAC